MGTRSTTRIYQTVKYGDEKPKRELLLALYKQYDGYPKDGWGDQLKEFIKSGQFVNGINSTKQGSKKFMFNGMGCFALQLATEFKKESGGLYATTEKDRQEYNYVIEYVYPADLKDVKQKVVNRLEDTRFNQALVKISCEEEPSFNEDIIVEVY